MLLIFAIINIFKLYQLDVKSTFINIKIKELYVSQSLRFVNAEPHNHIFRQRKLLYGLKQVPKTWYNVLNLFLLNNDFMCRNFETTLFTKVKKIMKF